MNIKDDRLGRLSEDDYYLATKLSIVVSIDIILLYNDKILLGKRINEPAKNFFFTPGGRLHKGESIKDGFRRISKEEFGLELDLKKSLFVNIFEHFYENNFKDDKHKTQYLNLAYKYKLEDSRLLEIINKIMKNQHNEILWLSELELLKNNNVHKYVKKYFNI